MRRTLPLVLIAAFAVSGAFAGEAAKTKTRVRLWRLPFYAVLGFPRDVVDAPVKGLSSIPVFNRVFIAPLYLTNILTSYTCWSFTEDGIGGGFDAWFHCTGMARKRGKHVPKSMRDRTAAQDYLPNWRTFKVVSEEPVDQ